MERLNLGYLYERDISKYQFYKIPKLLIENDSYDTLDYGAKLLYGIMIDRASCSATKGSDFIDKQGRVYIIFTIDQIMATMQCSSKTAVKMIKQLDDIGLIERNKRGQGKASLIYVKDFSSLQFLNCRKYNSKIAKNTTLELEKVQCSNSNLSNTNLSNTNSINHSQNSKYQANPEQIETNDDEIKELVKKELLELGALPQQYIIDKQRLKAAIHFISEWDTFYPNGYRDEHKQYAYNLFNDALIKMCHTTMKLSGEDVTSDEVVERINQLATFRNDYIDISIFSEPAMEKYIKASKESTIGANLKYMASCIWDAMITGQISTYEECYQ